ncbi:MAG: hypothetical protein WBA51_12720 [Erythrobacter sp.]
MNAVASPPASRSAADHGVKSAGAPDARTKARLRMRVLVGRNKGAEHSLPPDRKISIGHSYENDIVLRDADSRGFSLHITPHGRLAALEVIIGRIKVLGRELVAGETVMLEPYVPVRMSGFVFAIGEANEERWLEAQEIADDSPFEIPDVGEAALPTNITERIELRTQPLRSRYSETLSSPLTLLMAAALMLVIAGGTWFGTRLLAATGPTTGSVYNELIELGYGRLTVERANNGTGLAIVGLVPGEDDLLRLKSWAASEHPDLSLGVATLDSAAEAADNLLAAQSVDASVMPDGETGLLIETEFLPKDRKTELEALLKRDLPRVRSFTFKASADRGESDLAYFFNAPGYGAASFVAGDPSYIVTEDGTRWFAGANLPTGHTIIEIRENNVTVERDGLRDTLVM